MLSLRENNMSIRYAERLGLKVLFQIICRSLRNGEDSSTTGNHRSGISFNNSLGSGGQKNTRSKWQLNFHSPHPWPHIWEWKLRTQWLRELTSPYPWESSVFLHPYRKSKTTSMVRLLLPRFFQSPGCNCNKFWDAKGEYVLLACFSKKIVQNFTKLCLCRFTLDVWRPILSWISSAYWPIFQTEA